MVLFSQNFAIIITWRPYFQLSGYHTQLFDHERVRLASVGILGIDREPEVDKLGWHGNFVCGFFELFSNSECFLVYEGVQ